MRFASDDFNSDKLFVEVDDRLAGWTLGNLGRVEVSSELRDAVETEEAAARRVDVESIIVGVVQGHHTRRPNVTRDWLGCGIRRDDVSTSGCSRRGERDGACRS